MYTTFLAYAFFLEIRFDPKIIVDIGNVNVIFKVKNFTEDYLNSKLQIGKKCKSILKTLKFVSI